MNSPPADSALTVFVYFRTAPRDRERADAALRALQAALRASVAVQARSGLRRDVDKPYLTWLEVYEPVPAARLQVVLDAIDAGARASGLAALALEGRHTEVFEHLPDALAGDGPADRPPDGPASASAAGPAPGPAGRQACA